MRHAAFRPGAHGKTVGFAARWSHGEESRYGLQIRGVTCVTLSIRGFISFATPAAAPIATGWSEPVPGRDFHPLWISTFSRRTSKSAVAPCSYTFITDQLKSNIFRTERKGHLFS